MAHRAAWELVVPGAHASLGFWFSPIRKVSLHLCSLKSQLTPQMQRSEFIPPSSGFWSGFAHTIIEALIRFRWHTDLSRKLPPAARAQNSHANFCSISKCVRVQAFQYFLFIFFATQWTDFKTSLDKEDFQYKCSCLIWPSTLKSLGKHLLQSLLVLLLFLSI